MNNSGYSLGNLVKNLTVAQKLGIGLGFVIIILLLVFVGFLVGDMSSNEQENDNNDNSSEIVEETYTDENGYTVTTNTYINESGEKVTEGTKKDEYGNVTTLDPNLITTYFPYQVVRKHQEPMNATLRYYLAVNEETKTIKALVEECDVAGDQALVQQYVDSIPLDLSEYTIVYDTFVNNAICSD